MPHTSEPPNSQVATPKDHAIARSRLYFLVSQLFHSGLTSELVPIVQQLDDLNAVLPPNLEPSELAASHQQIFGLALFAHESIFLDASGMLGGQVAETVVARYAQLGYQNHLRSADSDQLGAELGLLAFLCGAEAEAWADSHEAEANRMRQTQGHFLQEHLLRWLAPCLWAIRLEDDPFFTTVADITWELVSDHAAEITVGPASPFSLPEPPDLLTDPKTSLRDIAEYLMTPCHSGLFISRTTIGNLGRVLQLPRGFTDRTTMLVNLMQSAAQYDGTLPLLDKLIDQFQATQDWYSSHSNESTRFALQPWIQRTGQTVELLTTIKSSALTLSDNDSTQAEN